MRFGAYHTAARRYVINAILIAGVQHSVTQHMLRSVPKLRLHRIGAFSRGVDLCKNVGESKLHSLLVK